MSEKPVTVTEEPYATLNEDVVEEGALGAVCIHNDVIAAIAHEAASGVPGVSELPGDILDGIAGMIGRKTADRGIAVQVEDDSVALDIRVILEHGAKIPHVAWQIQQSVKDAVEDMTGKNVSAVNVIVQGIKTAAMKKAGSEG